MEGYSHRLEKLNSRSYNCSGEQESIQLTVVPIEGPISASTQGPLGNGGRRDALNVTGDARLIEYQKEMASTYRSSTRVTDKPAITPSREA